MAARSYKAYEWFVQDSWKATRRLTLELGVRFVAAPPGTGTMSSRPSGFEKWNPQNEVQLLRPQMVNGKRMAVDPITGKVYPAVFIGVISPDCGNFANGMVLEHGCGHPARNG